MKRSLLTFTAAIAIAATTHAAPLTVQLNGVEARGGKLYVSVQTKEQFMKNAGTAGEIVDAPSAGTFTATYDVPEGAYAVSIWHDDNGNGEFDRDHENAMPLDGWAMHNSSTLTGPPTFENVSIQVSSSGATVTENMVYGR